MAVFRSGRPRFGFTCVDNSSKRSELSCTERLASSGSDAHDQICTGEENVEAVHVFRYAAVYNFVVTELLFDN